MKALIIFSLAFLIAGCNKVNEEEQLSPEQLSTVENMVINLELAKVYNDSIGMIRLQNPNSPRIAYCDSLYHHYVYAFDSCHNQFQHNSYSANHSHGQGGMVQMHNNGMMGNINCGCCTNGGHSADMHLQMSGLQDLHREYISH